jgi:hypothetical protein
MYESMQTYADGANSSPVRLGHGLVMPCGFELRIAALWRCLAVLSAALLSDLLPHGVLKSITPGSSE